MLRLSEASQSGKPASPALEPDAIAHHWRRWAMLGSSGALLGMLTIALATSLPGMIGLLGPVLAADAVLHLLHARLQPRYAGAGWHLLCAAASLGGAGMLLAPLPQGLLPPALTIGLVLLVTGLGRAFLGVMLQHLRSWPWLFSIGVVTGALGLGLLMLPWQPSLPLLGAALGLTLLLEGLWTVNVARHGRSRRISMRATS